MSPVLLAVVVGVSVATAAEPKARPTARPAMDLGPAVAFIFNNAPTNRPLGTPDERLVLKALSIRLGTNAGTVFDTELLRYSSGWTGGFIDVRRSSITASAQGSSPVFPIGQKVFNTSPSNAKPAGAKYKGHYLHGGQVVLSYSIDGTDILDQPGIETENGVTAFTRTLRINPSATPMELFVSENSPPSLTVVSGGAGIETDGKGRTRLKIPKHDKPVLLKLSLGGESVGMKPPVDPEQFTKGGPARWTAPVTTQGTLGTEPGAHVVDTLALPVANPWNSWMRISALDFFDDGRCAVSTLSGDVWVVSGIDAGLQKLTWKRFATGLYEPLGMKIVNDTVHVLGRDRLTRLRDIDGDGEADFYESFNSDLGVYPTYHAFIFDLHTDKAGNFYFATDGNMVDPFLPNHGSVMKVSADGSKLEEYARGFRTPNGMGVGPNGEITCSDNQGHWTPASKISWIERGGYFGYGGDPRQPKFPAFHKEHPLPQYDAPLCWIPMNADNSSGSQVWVTSDQWGLPRGSMLHTSYGKCTLFSVMVEDVAGTKQAGAWQFPLKFSSGIMRARFSPVDGQLYVGGLKGWQTVARDDGALQRVRYTGKSLEQPVALHVRTNGLEITFGTPLKPASAGDIANYGVAQWNYLRSTNYGSDSWSVANPKKKGEDAVVVKSAKLSGDGRTVFLETQPLQPVMQMRVKYSIDTAASATLSQEIHNTINRVK